MDAATLTPTLPHLHPETLADLDAWLAEVVDSVMPAAHFYSGRLGGITRIVVHDMEAPERLTIAEDVGRYFASGRVRASAHLNVDADSIVQSVHPRDTAFHAPGANHDGIGIEHAGYARQNRHEWLDAYGLAMLERSARLVAGLCWLYGIPPVHLTDAEIAAGKPGLVEHRQVSRVYRRSDHWDPGYSFPWDVYLAMIAYFYPSPTGGPHHPEDPMSTEHYDALAAKIDALAAGQVALAIRTQAPGCIAQVKGSATQYACKVGPAGEIIDAVPIAGPDDRSLAQDFLGLYEPGIRLLDPNHQNPTERERHRRWIAALERATS